MKELGLKDIQNTELNILIKFDEVCKKNGINYSLCGGTLIGAVRHNGFIPWDDDIDVYLMREDYERLIALHYEDERYEIRCHRYTKGYYYPFVKMVDKRTYIDETWRAEKDMGIYIDIFPVDVFNYNSQKELNTILKKVDFLITVAFMMGHKLSHHRSFSIRYFLKLLMLTVTYPFKKQIISFIDKYASSFGEGGYCCMLIQHAREELVFEKCKLDEIINCNFEGYSCPIYKNYDYMLTRQYGDYMKLPPVNERHSVHGFKAYLKDESNE